MRSCSNIDSLWRSPRHLTDWSLTIHSHAGGCGSGVHWTENGDELQSAIAAHLYAGSFLGLSALMICAMGVLTMYVPTTPKSAQQEGRDDRF